MHDITRRSIAAGVGLLAGAVLFRANAQSQLAVATAPKFRAQPLTFNPDKIKWLSADAIARHYEIYGENVDRLNALTEEIAQLDFAKVEPAKVAELKREQHEVFNSALMHELYFQCLGDAPTKPSGVFAQAISRDFGGLDRWKAEFAATAKSVTGGKGLVMLTYSPRDKRLINHLCADHSSGPAGCAPLAVLDMYEHAYKPVFGDDSAKYVDSFVQTMHWVTPERLYREAIRV